MEQPPVADISGMLSYSVAASDSSKESGPFILKLPLMESRSSSGFRVPPGERGKKVSGKIY